MRTLSCRMHTDMDDTLVLTSKGDHLALDKVATLSRELAPDVNTDAVVQHWRQQFRLRPWDTTGKVGGMCGLGQGGERCRGVGVLSHGPRHGWNGVLEGDPMRGAPVVPSCGPCSPFPPMDRRSTAG